MQKMIKEGSIVVFLKTITAFLFLEKCRKRQNKKTFRIQRPVRPPYQLTQPQWSGGRGVMGTFESTEKSTGLFDNSCSMLYLMF
jgi:hypothetical protein